MKAKSNKVCFDGRIVELLLTDDEFHRTICSNQKISTGRFPKTDQWCDDDENFNLIFALAGYSASDINISVEGRFLKISSEKIESELNSNQIEKGIICRGIARRSFSKSYFVDSDYDLDLTEAKMENGLLELSIPKLKDKKIKNISIRSK